MSKKESLFNNLLNVDVSKHTYQKPISRNLTLTYLQWAWAYRYMMELDPSAKIEFKEFPEYDFKNGHTTGRKVDYMDTSNGCYVTAVVTIKGRSKAQSLPVMDNRNKAMIHPDMMAINRAKQRCFVKCLALFGLGLRLYGRENIKNYKNPNHQPAQTKRMSNGGATQNQVKFIKNLIFKVAKVNGSSFGAVAKWLVGYYKLDSVNKIPYNKADPIIKMLQRLTNRAA